MLFKAKKEISDRVMKRHGGNRECILQMNKVNLRRLLTVGVQLFEILEKEGLRRR